jgi:hypothetical protein
MDRELHRARIDKGRKLTFEAPLHSLPDGCFVCHEGCPYLVLGNALLRWTPEGYTRCQALPANAIVPVLTPEPIVRCFQAGYETEIHESRLALSQGPSVASMFPSIARTHI